MVHAIKRASPSLITAIALWCALCVVQIVSPPNNVIGWDSFGYHLYLPATFIHHDPSISDPSWVHAANGTYKSTGTVYQISELPDGRWVNKYPMGLAMLWSPFFLAAHVLAPVLGEAQDGFSKPYQWAMIVAAWTYLLIGLLWFRKLLLLWFSEQVTLALLLLIVLGTNYLHQAIQGAGMPHLYLFGLGAGVLLYSTRWSRGGHQCDALMVGALLGLMVVSRPSEIVWTVVPLLIGFAGPKEWRTHVRMLWSKKKHLLLMAATAALICSPQLLYWKWMTGKWLYMSYNNPGEGFEFLHPYTWEVLFSFRKGWFVYTPLMLLATIGLFCMKRYVRDAQWMAIVFFALNLYVVSSWSCWWFADSFGQRALVQSYALMALPLGALLMRVREARFAWRMVGGVGVLLLVGLSLFQFWQMDRGILHTSRMTWPAYAAAFGETTRPEGLDDLLLVERSYTGANDRPDADKYVKHSVCSIHFGDSALLTHPAQTYSPVWRTAWEDLTDADHVWLNVSCRIQRPADGSVPHVSLNTKMEHKGHTYAYMAREATLDAIAPGSWQRIELWYLSPEVRRPSDEVVAYCWLHDTLPVLVDDLQVVLYEPKTKR